MPRKPTLNNINEICINLTRLHLELIKYKEYVDQLKCNASEAIGEQDKPYDCVELLIAQHQDQNKIIDNLLAKQAKMSTLLFDILEAYDKKDIVNLEKLINEIRTYSKTII